MDKGSEKRNKENERKKGKEEKSREIEEIFPPFLALCLFGEVSSQHPENATSAFDVAR